MSNTSMVVRAKSASSGAPTTVAIDVVDEVPDPGDVIGVYVQLCDSAGNGVALAGAIVGLTVGSDVLGDEANGTLSDTTVTTDADGYASTWLTIDAGAAAGVRLYVYSNSLTLP